MITSEQTSPSSREAWIEIAAAIELLHGGKRSPSSREAWIEMPVSNVHMAAVVGVAFLAGGVD